MVMIFGGVYSIGCLARSSPTPHFSEKMRAIPTVRGTSTLVNGGFDIFVGNVSREIFKVWAVTTHNLAFWTASSAATVHFDKEYQAEEND